MPSGMWRFVLCVFPALLFLPLSGYALIEAMIKIKRDEYPKKELVILTLAGISLWALIYYSIFS